MKKLLKLCKKFFSAMIEALVEARKARAEAITRGIGR
jgi:hypothetical protein